MLNYIKTLWRPEIYHGSGKNANFFEGWFFKIVDRAKEHIFAFIPGISLGEDPHAFIQILDGRTHQSSYVRFPVEDFISSTKKMEIRIGDNIFSGEAFELNISSDHQQIKGKLDFGELKPWPVKIASPGVMGWYAFVPLMECFHGVISFDHTINGELSINENNIQFDGGRGYIEKDWGTSFPSAYVWIQSNHFEQPGVSLMASVAKIPWLRKFFRGFIIGLFIDNKLFRFTTYNGARLNYLRLSDFQVQLQVSDKNYILNIEALRAEGGLLHAPYKNHMLTRISETLNSQVKIELFHRQKNSSQLIFSGEGNPAGLDVNGILKDIIDT
jgi:hypothetical protein